MIRGTTPPHTFKLPIDVQDAKQIRIIYAQNDEVLFVKTKPELGVSGNEVRLRLTQEETLMFDHGEAAEIQLRVLTAENNALASKVIRIPVGMLLEDEVME